MHSVFELLQFKPNCKDFLKNPKVFKKFADIFHVTKLLFCYILQKLGNVRWQVKNS